MDGYDDGYWTQDSSYPQYRHVLVDGSGRVISSDGNASVSTQPVRVYASTQQPLMDRPRTQIYRIGPRFNASVTRVDRRGSVDSGLSQVMRLGGTADGRVVSIRPSGYNYQLQPSPTGVPQVVHLGSGRMRVGADNGTPQRVYRLVPGDSGTPPRTVLRSLSRTAAPMTYQQTSEPEERLPVSVESVPRVVSYQMHPVRSETDFGRSGMVYSSEWHTPVNQYQGGPGASPSGSSGVWTAASNDQYDSRKSSGNLSRGNSNDSDAYGTPPGTDDRRTVHIQIGGTSDNSRRSSNTGADSFQQVYQTQLPAYQETSYYTSQPTTSFNTPYSETGITPNFTVTAVGPVTDFGQLVCENIRQFLLHKQRQQQQQQGLQSQQSTVPWRRPRNVVSQVSMVSAPQPDTQTTPTTVLQRQVTLSNSEQKPDFSPSNVASPTADDRNMFQRYNFQFGSIGNFGRATTSRNDIGNDVNNVATLAGTGSWGKRVHLSGSGSTGPIAVFRFQDFDDMVARMREQSEPQTTGGQASTEHLQPPQKQLQTAWHGTPLHTGTDEETDDDSGYSTSRSMTDYQSRDVVAPVMTPADDAQVSAAYIVNSREELRRKISSFNNNSHGHIMSLEQNSNVYHGFIRVVMNLIQPVQMSLSTQPTSMYDVTTSRDHNNAAKVTTFHLPKDTTKVIHITSETTTREVIRMLLAKFHIQDNPRKFALYEQSAGEDGYMRRLADAELPLPLCLHWADAGNEVLNRTGFVLQENDTGEIMWEAFSLPELESFLLILHKEEETYLQEIKETYRLLKIQMQQRCKQLKQDRIAPGCTLKPVAT